MYFLFWPVCGRSAAESGRRQGPGRRLSGCISGFGPYVEGRRQGRVGGRGQGGGSPDVFLALCGRSAVRSTAGARRGIGETSGKS